MTDITQDNLYLLLPSKVCWIADMLIEDTGEDVVEAVCRIYQSGCTASWSKSTPNSGTKVP